MNIELEAEGFDLFEFRHEWTGATSKHDVSPLRDLISRAVFLTEGGAGRGLVETVAALRELATDAVFT